MEVTGVICRSVTLAFAGHLVSNVPWEATHRANNTLKLLTVICLGIMVSLACIEGMTKAVSVSLDANKSSFVSSYVTMSCCKKHRSVLEESSLPLRTCLGMHGSVEHSQVYLCASDRHTCICLRLNT